VNRTPLTADPSSVGIARRAARLACVGPEDDIDAIVQCTSELVTNALLHGAPPILLETASTAEGVRISVHDAGPGVAEIRTPLGEEHLSGRGLGIIDVLASRWGSASTADGKVVWFELDGVSLAG